MQAANVHAILESGPFVQKVQARLNDSNALIDDLDETLAIFDLKLRHMREDIAAIESRNNRWLPQPCHLTIHHQANTCSLSDQLACCKAFNKHCLSCWHDIKQWQTALQQATAYAHCAGKAAGDVSSSCILR